MTLTTNPIRAIGVVLASVAVGVAVPVVGTAGGHVRGDDLVAPPHAGPVVDPPVPSAAPGDKAVVPGPSAAEIAEEQRTATPQEQQELLAGVRRLVACARARGVDVPDPEVDPHGAVIPWSAGQPTPETSAAVDACLPPAADED